jgi:hypothetical protein
MKITTRRGGISATTRIVQIAIGVLSLFALVLGVVAMSGAGDSGEAHYALQASHTTTAGVPVNAGEHSHSPIGSQAPSATTITNELQECGATCALGCAMVGMACLLGFTALLASVKSRAHEPQTGEKRPRPPVRPALRQLQSAIATPSLTALSISRT